VERFVVIVAKAGEVVQVKSGLQRRWHDFMTWILVVKDKPGICPPGLLGGKSELKNEENVANIITKNYF
jgi:hypothetical protein